MSKRLALLLLLTALVALYDAHALHGGPATADQLCATGYVACAAPTLNVTTIQHMDTVR